MALQSTAAPGWWVLGKWMNELVILQAAAAKSLAYSFLMPFVLGLKFALKSQEERLYIN